MINGTNTVIVLAQINPDTKVADFLQLEASRYPDLCLNLTSVAPVQGLVLEFLFGSEIVSKHVRHTHTSHGKALLYVQ